MFILWWLLMIMVIFIIFIFIMSVLGGSSLNNKQSMSPFECGAESACTSRIPFSTQFFLISLIFILFDMEIIFFIHITNYFPSMSSVNSFLFFVSLLGFMWMTLLQEWVWNSTYWVC